MLKYKFFFLLMCFFPHLLYAQKSVDELKDDSIRLYVEYADYNGYYNDSIYQSLVTGSLFLGHQAAIYIYQQKPVEEHLRNFRNNIKDDKIRDDVVNGFKAKYNLEKMFSTVFIRYYNSPDYLLLKTREEGDVWYSDTIVYKWNLQNEFKTINGYHCQKAIKVSSDENEAIAWFTEDIPLSAGPLYLSGLPGLILEYFNSKNKRFFKATTISSIQIPEQKFRDWLTGPVVNKVKYREMYYGDSKKLEQMIRMAETNKN